MAIRRSVAFRCLWQRGDKVIGVLLPAASCEPEERSGLNGSTACLAPKVPKAVFPTVLREE